MSRLLALLAVALALPAPGVRAAEVIHRDAQGRPIHLDARVAGAPTRWAAGIVSRAAHGDEISRVTLRLVSRAEVAATCGRGAAGCYRALRGGAVVVVPGRRTPAVAHTLLHEYGHHVDWMLRNGGLPEPNGSRLWWRARGMGALLVLRAVSPGYQLGWERSIGEVFAEDYARVNGAAGFRVPWLKPPDAVVRRALLADLGLARPPPLARRPPQVQPFLLERSGTLAAGDRASLRFGLLGPGRRAVVSAELSASTTATLQLVCGRRVVSRSLEAGAAGITLRVGKLGPGRCRATIANTGVAEAPYALRLRVFLPV